MMQIIQQVIHYFLHFVFPLGIAFLFFRMKWKKVYLFFLLTMLVDADHLLSNPVFDVCRCSIGFHPLHSYPAIIVYVFMLAHPKSRIIAIGLLMHMVTDYIDCLFITYNCA
ncbi:MAG: DUF6122 family protein [Chitinophagaceae bacterium]